MPEELLFRNEGTAGNDVFSADFYSRGNGPAYMQLSKHLARAMDSGVLLPGAPLPPERDLATALRISRSTVARALAELRFEGRVISVRGSGTRVADLPPSPSISMRPETSSSSPEVPIREWSENGVINLSASKFAAPPTILEVFERAIRSSTAERILRSPGYSSTGLPELREAIARHYTSTGFPTNPSQILVTTGAQQALSLVAEWSVGHGDGVVVEDPTYSGAIDAFRAVGAHFISVDARHDGAHLLDLTSNRWAMRARALYVMPSFHNPMGYRLDSSVREALIEYIEESGVTLIEDNALAPINLTMQSSLPLAAETRSDNAVVVDSLSKVYWGGLRIGWVRGSERVISVLAKIKSARDLSGPLIDQLASVELVENLQDTAIALSRVSRSRADILQSLLSQQLPSWDFEPPMGGLSLWVHLPQGNALDFASIAHQLGVDVVPGSTLSPTNRHSDRIRLTFARKPELLQEGVQRLATAWERYSTVLNTVGQDRIIS